MEEKKRFKVYKIIMLIVIVAFVSFLITSIGMYQLFENGNIDNSMNILQIAEIQGNISLCHQKITTYLVN